MKMIQHRNSSQKAWTIQISPVRNFCSSPSFFQAVVKISCVFGFTTIPRNETQISTFSKNILWEQTMKSKTNPLTEKQKTKVLKALNCTGSLDIAADLAGCSIEDIEEQSSVDENFGEQVRSHKYAQELAILNNLLAAAKDPKQWRASLVALQLMEPDRYMKRRRDEITSADIELMMKKIVEIIGTEGPTKENIDKIRETLKAEIEQILFPKSKTKKGQKNELAQ
jgi:hypothetical protein